MKVGVSLFKSRNRADTELLSITTHMSQLNSVSVYSEERAERSTSHRDKRSKVSSCHWCRRARYRGAYLTAMVIPSLMQPCKRSNTFIKRAVGSWFPSIA